MRPVGRGERSLHWHLSWYDPRMIQKVMKKSELTDSSTGDNLSFWRSRPPSERIAAVEILRR